MAYAVPRKSSSSSTVLGATTPAAAPTMSFQDAVAQYQQANTVSTQSYEGLFPYLQNLGFQVERPTHAGGTLQSDDKIVNSQTGEVFDLISDVGGPSQGWTFGASGYWVNGKPSDTAPGAAANPTPTGPRGAPPPHNGNPNNAPVVGQAIPRGSTSSNAFASARSAQSRIRQQARGTGRSSTILAGFGNNPPRTLPATVLGR